MIPGSERIECPSCGGAGGGPFGPAGSAWDKDDYVCPRCAGEGIVTLGNERPGVVKATPPVAVPDEKKRKATG